MTASAPAAIAFAMSPDERIPPSATIGTPCPASAWAASNTAVTCGTPTPATTRVVQIDPGPGRALQRRRPRRRARAPRRPSRRCRRSPRSSCAPLIRRTTSRTPCEWPWAVSTTSRSTSDSTSAAARSSASFPTPTAAPTRSRPCSSFVASGYLIRFEMSLTVMSPLSRPSRVDDRQLLDLVAVQDLARLVERRPDRRRDEVAARHQRRDRLRRVGLEAEVAVREDADEDSRRRP